MLEIGQKVTITETFTRDGVVKAKTGAVGLVINFGLLHLYKNGIPYTIDSAIIEQSSGKTIEVPINIVKHYEKKAVKTLKSMTNEELLNSFELLVSKEIYSRSTKTKSYQKIVDDIEKYKIEIIKRMSN